MLIRLVIAWLLGIVIADILTPSLVLMWSIAGGALLGVGLFRRQPNLRLMALLALVGSLGGLRYQTAIPPPGADHVAMLIGRGEQTMIGWVAADPRRSDDGQRLVLQIEAVRVGDQARRAQGLVQLTVAPYPAYRYGQRLLVTGALQQPRPAERPGSFDYRAYLAHRGIFAILNQPAKLTVLEGDAGLPPLRMLLQFREHCRQLMIRMLPEPQAAIGVGILLGIQSSIPDETYTTFSVTGTSHILVVSGWNFTIVATLLAGVATRLRLGRGSALGLALSVMWIYAFFTGASAAVLRAAVMASLAAIGRAADREREPWHLLAGGCGLLTIADPHALWDVGFQLSALATASLFAFARPIEQRLARHRPFRWAVFAPLSEAFTATMAAQVLTLPLILYQFGNLSLVAPLANILLVPIVPYAMAACTLALLAGLIWLPLGQFLGPIAWLPVAWLTEGARILAMPAWAATQIPPFPLWIVLGSYGIILIGWMRRRRSVP
ncbi:ComEC family competence protein [Candidatus Chloroploca sp. M-50]|uniref:ComEC family competence protein n=1 Tax=Candidatus Chloroploca mongolica TaxID=2528176 RepID=A0ABS4D4F6_9CHLR|nr:ComEC/Rec2 family competence protein [Candidatus Chloroploca mongolica]MBP1464320.1 ComEC family competence protein [Candidatus Chloroploca mongolica]